MYYVIETESVLPTHKVTRRLGLLTSVLEILLLRLLPLKILAPNHTAEECEDCYLS